jgi:hypothetical protein
LRRRPLRKHNYRPPKPKHNLGGTGSGDLRGFDYAAQLVLDVLARPGLDRHCLERLLGANPHRPPVPFAGGTRRCIEASFAQSEIRIALGQIVTEMRLELLERRPARTVLRCVTLLPAGEVPVFVTARRASKPAFSPGGSAHMICVLGCSISCRASARAAGRDSGGPDSRG